jgi:hypothetical protein
MIDIFGIELTKEQINNVLLYLEQHPETYIHPGTLTEELWEKEFGLDKQIQTPIGIVKLGNNQFAKMYNKGRNSKFGMIKPTLQTPDIIVTSEGISKTEKPVERNYSYIYIKSFIGHNGERIYYFASVTNLIDGIEISISNQEKKPNKIMNLIKSGKLVYIKSATMLSTPASIAHGSQPTVRGGGTSTAKITKN